MPELWYECYEGSIEFAPAPKKIGTFSNLHHDIAGTAYAVNSTTILVKGFNYDGEAPDAFFLGGTYGQPSKHGEVSFQLFSKVFSEKSQFFSLPILNLF